jgi:hypothetical protein
MLLIFKIHGNVDTIFRFGLVWFGLVSLDFGLVFGFLVPVSGVVCWFGLVSLDFGLVFGFLVPVSGVVCCLGFSLEYTIYSRLHWQISNTNWQISNTNSFAKDNVCPFNFADFLQCFLDFLDLDSGFCILYLYFLILDPGLWIFWIFWIFLPVFWTSGFWIFNTNSFAKDNVRPFNFADFLQCFLDFLDLDFEFWISDFWILDFGFWTLDFFDFSFCFLDFWILDFGT